MDLQEFKQQWDDQIFIPVMEIDAFDCRTGEDCHLLFNLRIEGDEIVATHPALNEEQETSEKVATTKVKIDLEFSLDENLQEVYNECLRQICLGSYYLVAMN